MPNIRAPRGRALQPIQLRPRKDFTDLIMQTEGQTPWAGAIEQVGNIASTAIKRRGDLARVMALGTELGLSPEQAKSLTPDDEAPLRTLALNRKTETPEAKKKEQLALLKTQAEIDKLNFEASGRDKEPQDVPVMTESEARAAGKVPKGVKIIPDVPKTTPQQESATSFATRAKQANAALDSLANKGYDPTTAWAGIQKGPFYPEIARSDNSKLQEQAEIDFVTAVLRKESGATITKDEIATERAKYFPKAGDGPEVLEQKRRSREVAIQNLEREAKGLANPLQPLPAPQSNATPQVGGQFNGQKIVNVRKVR